MNTIQELLAYAQLAQASYPDVNELPDGYSLKGELAVENFYAGAYANGSSVVIAVRGSDDIPDWLKTNVAGH